MFNDIGALELVTIVVLGILIFGREAPQGHPGRHRLHPEDPRVLRQCQARHPLGAGAGVQGLRVRGPEPQDVHPQAAQRERGPQGHPRQLRPAQGAERRRRRREELRRRPGRPGGRSRPAEEARRPRRGAARPLRRRRHLTQPARGSGTGWLSSICPDRGTPEGGVPPARRGGGPFRTPRNERPPNGDDAQQPGRRTDRRGTRRRTRSRTGQGPAHRSAYRPRAETQPPEGSAPVPAARRTAEGFLAADFPWYGLDGAFTGPRRLMQVGTAADGTVEHGSTGHGDEPPPAASWRRARRSGSRW